jgi:histidinol-phosphate aminotransferase
MTDTLSRATVAFICNPNNPTGTLRAAGEIRDEASAHPDTLFVVDEAYLPFTCAASCLDGGLKENLVVLHSLTKDCAIPGLRLGYAVGPSQVIQSLRSVQPPWSVNAPAQGAGVAALASTHQMPDLRPAKEFLTSSLSALGLEVLPSETNFFLVHVGNGAQFRAALLDHDICVRDCASFGLPKHIRIGVRTLPECQQLVAAIGKVLKHAR